MRPVRSRGLSRTRPKGHLVRGALFVSRHARERGLPLGTRTTLPWNSRGDRLRRGANVCGLPAGLRSLVDDELAFAGATAPSLPWDAWMVTSVRETHEMVLNGRAE